MFKNVDNKTEVVISVVTYKRLRKWFKCLNNLWSVRYMCPNDINLNFLFVEDSKTPNWIFKIKNWMVKKIIGYGYEYVRGANNLGESRDLAITKMPLTTDYFGFIDDDDYYRPDVLQVLHTYLTQRNSLTPSIINFCMSGNFCLTMPPYKGYPEPRNRLRRWDDKNIFGCIPSCASFIRFKDWYNSQLKFGYNPPSEETSPLMVFTYYSKNVAHVGIELMYRNRANKSLVRNLGIYKRGFIESNVRTHINNLRKGCKDSEHFKYIYEIFKYNYGGYLESHGTPYAKEIFNKIENE